METAIFIEVYCRLRELGILSSAQDYARALGRGPQWFAGVRRRDGRAPRTARQDTLMRLRKRLWEWRDSAPRPTARAIDDLVQRLDAADVIARWLAR